MKKLLFAAVLLSGIFAACNNTNQGGVLEISVDKSEIKANGIDEAVFTVTLDGKALSGATLTDNSKAFEGYSFRTTDAGVHRITAAHDGLSSNTIIVTALNSLTLSADKYSIGIDGDEEVNFIVKLNGTTDVTAMAEIMDGSGNTLPEPVFGTTMPGIYKFHAVHEVDGIDLVSEEVAISVGDITFDPTADITKNVAFFAWTGTWCGPCYTFKTNMKAVLTDTGDRIIQANFHKAAGGDVIGGNPSTDVAEDQVKRSGYLNLGGYPSVAVDLQKSFVGSMSQTQIETNYAELSAISPKTGVMVNSAISSGKINVTVNIGAREAGDYSIGILLTEDHVSAFQEGFGYGYDHTNVARQMGTDSIFGDRLGAMAPAEVASRTFSFDVMPKYKTENLHLVIYTLYKDTNENIIVIDNTIKVPVNVSMGYNYAD